MILSILIGAALYILIEVAFIGALKPSLLTSQHGWTNLGTTNTNSGVVALNAGPFFTLVSIAGISWLATVLRIDAVVSPGGTGLMYETSSARLAFGLARNGYLPPAFERVNKAKVPVFGVIISTLIGVLFLLPFPSWSKLVGIVTSASVLMYAGAPIALGALRKQKPELPRPYRLPAGGVLAPLAFVGAGWIILFSGWQTYTTLMVAMLIGYALIFSSMRAGANERAPKMDRAAIPWIAVWLIGMGIISYLSDFGPGGIIGGIGIFKNVLDQGGTDAIGLWGGIIASAVFNLIIYYWAISQRLPGHKVDEYVREVYPPPVAE